MTSYQIILSEQSSSQSSYINIFHRKSSYDQLVSQEKNIQSSQNHYHYDFNESHLIMENIKNMTKIIKKFQLKRFISNLLDLRKQKDLEQTYIDVSNEHKCFRIMRRWKQIVKNTIKKQIQVEMILQKRNFLSKRKVLKAWSNIIKNNKKAELHYKKTIFNNFKCICASFLSIRLKKIQLTEILIRINAPKIISSLKTLVSTMKSKQQQALNHYQNLLKFNIFTSMRNNPQIKKQNLSYKKSKLATVFYRLKVNLKVFKILKNQNNVF